MRELIQSARRAAATTVNTLQVLINFEIGRRIVEHEQKGEKRAEYGAELLKELSARLTEEFGQGFSLTNLKLMRQFFIEYRARIGQPPSDQLSKIMQKPSAQFGEIAQTLSAESALPAKVSRKSPFTLSWSHYVLLLTIKNPEERSFYEIEASKSGWSLPELKRQTASCLYERLALSKDKKEVRRLADEGQVIAKPEDMLKEPYVLEFLGLDEKAGYSESDLETAIIDRLEQFLLELGKGFLFEARQKRFTFAVAKMRELVLQLAVQGKLVKQRRNNETATELLAAISRERATRKRNMRIPAEQPLTNGGTHPFQIPSNGAWTMLGNVALQIQSGYTASADPSLTEVRMLRITAKRRRCEETPQ